MRAREKGEKELIGGEMGDGDADNSTVAGGRGEGSIDG